MIVLTFTANKFHAYINVFTMDLHEIEAIVYRNALTVI